MSDVAQPDRALADGEAPFRALVEACADAVWEATQDGEWLDAVHPEDRPAAELRWRHAVEERSPFGVEVRIRAPDGGWRWTNVRAAPIGDDPAARWIGMNVDVHDIVVADREARHRREVVELVTDAMPVMMAVYDRDHRYVFVNRAMEEFHGRPKEDFVGRPMTDVLTAAVYARLLPWIERALAGETVEFEDYEPNRHGTGREGWTVEHFVPRRDVEGTIDGFYVLSVDVTPQKEQERALRRSEARYRSLFTSIDEGFAVIELLFDERGDVADFRFLEANPAFEEVTGIVDPVGRTIGELVPGLEREWLETYARVAHTGKPVRFRRQVAALGLWFDTYAFRLADAESSRVGVLFSDVTRQVRADEAGRIQAERQEHLLALTEAIAPMDDPDEIVEAATRLLRDRLVADRVEWVDGEPPDVVPPALLVPVERGGRRVAAIVVSIGRGRAFHDEEVALVRETAERVCAALERARAERRASEERARRERLEREFVANAAHELRTPLTAIVGSVDSLLAGAVDDPDARATFLGHLQRESARLARLVDSLLVLARIDEAGPVDRARVALGPLLREIADLVRQTKGVAVDVTVEDGLEAMTHVGLLERILLNLADNAARVSRNGSIALRATGEDGVVVIEVEDDGPGLTANVAEHAFERFFRGGRRDADGFGLGLSIVRKAAMVLGGDVGFAPVDTGGTVVRLRLP